ncbi:hypothetical protein ACROYT_G002323 [Oculina patagonica]
MSASWQYFECEMAYAPANYADTSVVILEYDGEFFGEKFVDKYNFLDAWWILKETFFTYRFYKAEWSSTRTKFECTCTVLHADESFQEKPTLSEISINRKNILNIAHPCFEVSVTNNHTVLQY